MKSIKNIFLITMLALMVGCTTTGVKVERDQLAKIENGVTTEQEVIAMLGKPTSVTTTVDSKVLHYDHQMSDQMGRSLASSAASIVGGLVAGPLGSMAGSMATRAVPANSSRERLMVLIDPKTNKVINYQHEKSASS